MPKKTPINIDGGALAAGFFSSELNQEKPKSKGGRPKKDKKKQQYTLTMDPELYHKLRKKAEEKNTSFSQLVTDAMIDYLDENTELPFS